MTKAFDIDELPPLKVSTGWIDLQVTGEPAIKRTFKGYAPVLPVRAEITGLDYILYISAKSMAEGLEPLREANGGAFKGIAFQIRKSSSQQFAPYEIEPRHE